MKEKTRVKPVWQRLMLRTAVVLSLAGTLAVPGQIQAQDNGIDISIVDLAVPEGEVDASSNIQYVSNSYAKHKWTGVDGPHDYVMTHSGGWNSAFGEYLIYKDTGTGEYIFCLEPPREAVGHNQTINRRNYTKGSDIALQSGDGSASNIAKAAVVMDNFYKGNQSHENYLLTQLYIWEIFGYGTPTTAVSGIKEKYSGFKNSISLPSNPSNVSISSNSAVYNDGQSSQTLGMIRGTVGGSSVTPGPTPGNPTPGDPTPTPTPPTPPNIKPVTTIESIPYKTFKQLDTSLEPGTTKVLVTGRVGRREITRYYVNGVENPSLRTERITVTKRDMIILHNPEVFADHFEEQAIPFGVEEIFDETLEPGTRIKVRDGLEGQMVRTVTYRNGVFYHATPWTVLRAPISERWRYNDNQYVTRQEPRNTAFDTIRRVNYNLEPGAYVEVQPGKTGREYRENTWLARADGTLIRLVSYGPQWIVDTLPQDRIIEYNPTPVIEKIPFETIIVQDPNRWDDEEPEEIQPGIEGEKEIYRHMDGSVTEAVKTNPQDRIIVVGTKPAYGAAEYTSEEIAPYETEVIESNEHDIYYRETIQQGVNGRKYVVYSRETYRGEWIENSRPVEVSSVIIEAPINEIIIQGTKAPSLD